MCLGDAVEQRDVDVVADAEGEDAALVRVAGFHQFADLRFGGDTDGGESVGQEQNDRQLAFAGRLAQRLDECVMDVGAADRAQRVKVGIGLGAVRFVGRHRLHREELDRRAVVDDVEGLAWFEAADDLFRGLFDLFERAARHAAGTIDDERHFALESVGVPGDARRDAGEQQEIAAADGRIGVAEERGGDTVALQQRREAEGARLQAALGFDLERDVARIVALHDQFMAGRVDGGDGAFRPDIDVDLPRRLHVERLAARQHVVEAVDVRGKNVLIGERHLLDATGGHGEDARADDVVAGELEQRRIARPPHDGVVDAARLLLAEQLCGRLARLAEEVEGVHRRAVGDGKQQYGLGLYGPRVAHGDEQARGGGSFEDPHARLHVFDPDWGGARRPAEAARLRDDDVWDVPEAVPEILAARLRCERLLGRHPRGEQEQQGCR